MPKKGATPTRNVDGCSNPSGFIEKGTLHVEMVMVHRTTNVYLFKGAMAEISVAAFLDRRRFGILWVCSKFWLAAADATLLVQESIVTN